MVAGENVVVLASGDYVRRHAAIQKASKAIREDNGLPGAWQPVVRLPRFPKDQSLGDGPAGRVVLQGAGCTEEWAKIWDQEVTVVEQDGVRHCTTAGGFVGLHFPDRVVDLSVRDVTCASAPSGAAGTPNQWEPLIPLVCPERKSRTKAHPSQHS